MKKYLLMVTEAFIISSVILLLDSIKLKDEPPFLDYAMACIGSCVYTFLKYF